MVSSQVAQSPSCRAHKFGGSSLADASRIRHVASLMLGAGEPRQVVVVSAMQGTTNALIAMTTAAAAGEDWQAAWSALRTQHADAASALLEAPAELHAWIDARFADIADLLRAVSLLRQPGRAALDRIQGMGEVLSATLLQAHLRARGADYALLDARDVLLVRHAELGAVVDWDESARRLDAWRAANPQPRVVVTGFVAGGEDGL
ncbi:MAG TPA: bifunctional aspartate kinase/homoserine dehydrogenase I, partial [Thermomonas sp.]|nr:bifunctional aspartate kinase/homoserine dehydrogenase I [Thermomonas sp.]